MSDTDIAIAVLVVLFCLAVTVLQVLWLLRVMRALEAIAANTGGSHGQIDQMRAAIVAIGRHIRGEPDPAQAPTRPRHSPKI